MTQTLRTAVFTVAALVAVGITATAYKLSAPAPELSGAEAMRNKTLFPKFERALDAVELEIIEFDPETAAIIPFKVAQVDGKWSIPSHENYPADAKDHLAAAATSLIGLKVLDVVAESAGQKKQAEFGVVEPNAEKLTAGATGVGKRVIMRDASGNTLADLIIGNEVPGADDQRYVRVTGEEPIYVVKLDPSELSSDFGDWIEKDLLQLNPWDIDDIRLNDYSFDAVSSALDPRSRIHLDYNDMGDPRWSVVEWKTFDKKTGTWVDTPVPEGKELDTSKLDAMRTALDDLKIIDVRRKPKAVGESLAAGEIKVDQETAESLASHGYYMVNALQYFQFFPPSDDSELKRPVELISSEGEVRVGMKDGVRYVLRFGTVAEARGKQDDESDGGVNRYVMVMAEYDPTLIPKPELEPLPELPAEDAKADENAQADENAEAQEAAADGEGEASSDDASNETSNADDIKAERERIEKENKRKQEEYDEKVKKAQERVKELNARFADWYYIVSDKVYQDIHLTGDAILKDKEPEDTGDDTTTDSLPESEASNFGGANLTPVAPAEEENAEPAAGESSSESEQAAPAEATETEPSDPQPAPEAESEAPADTQPADEPATENDNEASDSDNPLR
ncbi:MAG: DUF4340 domain-containing protein [Planctomycetota bacterium]|nr:MAG: DUF4340 domain-containing protein [Planctomycetota bacterium]